ncbi:MAG: hypothetical protein QMD85_02200 [Candidatus Aenigmarchaeota archaeon]|nr:hypothetical protein [Candidatus Aenigmarchaeota archaeon]
MQSKYRENVIQMMRNGWPLRKIRAWLLSNGEEISLMSLQRFRKRWIPPGDHVPRTYVSQKIDEFDIRLEALAEHARAIWVQKLRGSKVWEQEDKLGIVLPQGRKEMALLNKMLVDHQRMKEGLATVITIKEPDKQIIEVRWLEPGEKDKDNQRDGSKP